MQLASMEASAFTSPHTGHAPGLLLGPRLLRGQFIKQMCFSTLPAVVFNVRVMDFLLSFSQKLALIHNHTK